MNAFCILLSRSSLARTKIYIRVLFLFFSFAVQQSKESTKPHHSFSLSLSLSHTHARTHTHTLLKETEKGLVDCDSNGDKVRSVIQNDDADQQNPGSSSRDMGNDGCVLIKGCDTAEHRGFEVKLFEAPNGVQDNDNDFPIRVVLSSFWWGGGAESDAENGQLQGIPDGKSDCSLCTVNCQDCQSVKKEAAFNDSSTGYDGPQGYTRVHRDGVIVAAMRKWVGL